MPLANVFGPMILGLTAAVAGIQLLRRSPEAIWTPYAWFLLAVVAFYSVGPLLHSLAGPETRRLASSLNSIDSGDLLRTNLLDAVGVFCVLMAVWLMSALPVQLAGRSQLSFGRTGGARYVGDIQLDLPGSGGMSPVRPEVAAWTFLVVGGILKYLVILPVRFGIINVVLPGVIWNLGSLHLLGIVVVSYLVARGDHKWRVPLVVLWTLQIAVSLLLFSKLDLILSIVLPALGGYAAHRRIRRLLVWAVVACGVYVSVPQLVLFGRDQVYHQSGDINRAGLPERARIVREWISHEMTSVDERRLPVKTSWVRLDYAPVQAFAMERYQHGYPGGTLRYAGIVLIPRFIWPDKPVTTNQSVDLYQLMTGRRNNHLGLGIFGEGYWDLGWFGVMVFSLVTGAVFAIVSELGMRWIERKEFFYLPSVALGIRMGIVGITQNFANSVVGALALFALYAVSVSVLVRMLRSLRHTEDLGATRSKLERRGAVG